MRAASPTALWTCIVLVLCLATVAARAQSQEPESTDDHGKTPDRTSGAHADQKKSRTGSLEESAPPKSEPSRWERLRDSISPFRPKRQSSDTGDRARNDLISRGRLATQGNSKAAEVPARKPKSSQPQDESRRRWLIGKYVRYAPGEDPNSPDYDGAKQDDSVSRATYSKVQEPTQLPSLDPLSRPSPNAPGNITGAPDATPLPPGPTAVLPTPVPPSPDQPDASEPGAAAIEPIIAALNTEYEREPYNLCKRWLRGYPFLVEWFPKHLGPPRKTAGADSEEETFARVNGPAVVDMSRPGAPRRSPPSPWDSPPFPGSEYQGYPLIGTPMNPSEDPLQQALLRGPFGDAIRDSRIEVHGWVTVSGNWSNANRSNLPTAYWIVPNSFQVDQAILRFEREIDWVQTDHPDWGFRWVNLYGIDYRYTTAGGIFSQQLLYHNNLYGYDPVEFWAELYIPNIFQGMVIRLGRWIACPDIEAQYAPDNYLASHSLLFTYDTYTQTGIMFSFQLNQRNMVQGAIQSGTDMAPWYPGALPTGFFGWRWIAESNNDAFYTCLNNINNGKFRYFFADGRKAGHDNFNYIVTTWEHRFSQKVHTKTEAYYMWQFDAVVGGTPSLGAPQSFGGGGGLGTYLPGNSPAYGVLNYTMFQLSKRDYFTVRNEWWRDVRGERSGFATNYSSHTIGISHQFNDVVMIRPELGYYHSYDVPAFNLGRSKDLLMGGFDLTIRF